MYIIKEDRFFEDIKSLNFVGEKTDKQLPYLGPISKINFFVGANNTGKSTFLRNLLNQNSHKLTLAFEVTVLLEEIRNFIVQNKNIFVSNGSLLLKIHRENINKVSKANISKMTPMLKRFCDSGQDKEIQLNGTVFENLGKQIEKINEKTFIKFNEEIKFINESLLIALELFNSENDLFYRDYKTEGLLSYQINDRHRIESYFIKVQELIELYVNSEITYVVPTERIYIPILRTLTTLFNASRVTDGGRFTTNIFEGTLIKNYFTYDLNKEVKISTGLDLFQDILFARNNERKVRENFEAFEQFLSKTFFSGKDVDIIAKQTINDNEKHIYLYLDKEEHDIHKFGDGIQACILLLYPIFTAKDGAWIFIEEPELNMHPGFQRIFLTALLHNNDLNKKNLKYFITTHSNHLLDLTLTVQTNLSIFTFRESRVGEKKVRQIINVKSSDIDALELLGVNSSSVYLANCSIWVEGHSDTLFIRAFLKAYELELKNDFFLKEDLHYSFFEYGGSNVSHYLFSEKDKEDTAEVRELDEIKARFLSNKILLIADKDADKEKKHQLFKKIESKYFSYEALSVREVENLLSPDELRLLLPKLHSKLKLINFEKVKIEQNDYQSLYLGNYLKSKLKVRFPEGLKAKSGSIDSFYKRKLATLLSENITWESMSEQAKSLTKRVYKFIVDNNSL